MELYKKLIKDLVLDLLAFKKLGRDHFFERTREEIIRRGFTSEEIDNFLKDLKEKDLFDYENREKAIIVQKKVDRILEARLNNLRFELFLESKGLSVDKYLQDRNKAKNIEYMKFLDYYIKEYQKISGNEGTRVESDPDKFDDYLKFKVLGKCLEKIAYESIGIQEMENSYEAKELLEKYNITEETDPTKLYPRLIICFEQGNRKRIVDKYETLLEKIPESLKGKYLPELTYNHQEYTMENERVLSKNISIVDNIEKIEKNPFELKVFINYSESSSYKEKEVYSIGEMQIKSNVALEELKKERERLGLNEIYNKVDLTILSDFGDKIKIIERNRFDVGNYKDFNEFLKANISENKYNYIQEYKDKKVEIEEKEIKQDEEEEDSEEDER